LDSPRRHPKKYAICRQRPITRCKLPARCVALGGSTAAVDRHGLGHARRSRPSPTLRSLPMLGSPATSLQPAYLANHTQWPEGSQARLAHSNGYQRGVTTQLGSGPLRGPAVDNGLPDTSSLPGASESVGTPWFPVRPYSRSPLYRRCSWHARACSSIPHRGRPPGQTHSRRR
jgi:hypothetical protein